MNKYLMLSAAAALATGLAGSSDAANYDVHFIGASGTSFCDGYIGETRSVLAGGEHNYSVCAALGDTWLRNIPVLGLKAKNKNILKGYYFSDDSPAMSLIGLGFGATTAFNASVDEYVLAAPIEAGSKWQLWCQFGTSAYQCNHGTLAAGQYVKANGKNKNVQTSMSVISEILRKTLRRPANKS